jgi:very-short-patch-repair endonuclease
VDRKRHPKAAEQYRRALARKNLEWGDGWTYERAGEMRSAPTSAEAIVWEWLRGNQTGLHFRRQAVVANHILDFYSGLVRIAVEVDGKTHDPDQDRERDELLRKEARVATIRVPAREVYRDIGAVFDDVRGRILGILARDGWRRKKYLEYYGERLYWRRQNKNLAVWELYDNLTNL